MTKKNNMEELKKVRKNIDNIDNRIIELIGDRFKEIHKVTKLMDFISKSQGYIPLKAVPYIFFLAVVLSITTSTNTFV